MNAKELVLKNRFFSYITKDSNFRRFVFRPKVVKKFTNYERNAIVLSFFSKFRKNGFVLHSSALALAFPLFVKAWGKDDHKEQAKKILEEADRLFEESQFEKLNEILRSQPSWYDNYEILWRVARCEFHLSKKEVPNSKPFIDLIEEANRHVIKALELCDECGPAHKVIDSSIN